MDLKEYLSSYSLHEVELSLPSRKDSRWKYTNFMKFLSLSFEKGSYNSTIPKGNVDLNEIKKYIKDNVFAQIALASNNINHIKHSSGTLKISNLSSGASFAVNIIDIPEKSDVVILESSNAEANSSSIVLNIFRIGESAKVNHKKNQIYNSDNTYVLDNTYYIMSENSNMRLFSFSKGADILRNNIKAIMHKDSSSIFDGIYKVKDKKHFDTFLRLEHLESSYSEQTYKGIVSGKAAFVGSIYIDKNASNTTSKQLNKTLLLNGEMNSKPELEIENDEVICSHGSTIGDISRENLFYLESRGLSKNSAKEHLFYAFLNDLVKDEEDRKIFES